MAAALSNLNKYGHLFQSKVIGSLINDRKFLINISKSIKEEYFENESQKWIVTKVLEYYKKYHTTPSDEFLVTEIKKMAKGNEILNLAIEEELKKIYDIYDSNESEYIQEEFSSFCVNQKVKNAIIESTELLKVGDFDEIKKIIIESVRSLDNDDLGHDYEKDVEERYREESRNPISLPWKQLNNIFGGGFGEGDLALVFGNPGGGKSWLCVSIAVFAAVCGYNVIYYTLELGESYVGKRLDANLTKIPVSDLDRNKDEVIEALKSLSGKVKVKEYPPKRASLNDIESHYNKLRTQENFKADLIIIDYLDLLRSRSKLKERKDQIDDIYYDAKGLAKELKIPIISPSQVNRSGAQDNIIEGDKAAGSYDKMMVADISMSLSRKRKDKINNTARLHIMKNRYGGDGISFICDNVDLSVGNFNIVREIFEDDEEFTNDSDSNTNTSSSAKKVWKDWNNR